MHFVDHVDLVAALRGSVHRALQKRGHLFNGAVGGRVDFDVVNETPFINRPAGFALAAGVRGHAPFAVFSRAVKALRKNTGERCLTHAARAGKKVGMMQTVFVQCMLKCRNNGILTDHTVKVMRTPFAGKYLVAHENDPERVTSAIPGWLYAEHRLQRRV